MKPVASGHFFSKKMATGIKLPTFYVPFLVKMLTFADQFRNNILP